MRSVRRTWRARSSRTMNEIAARLAACGLRYGLAAPRGRKRSHPRGWGPHGYAARPRWGLTVRPQVRPTPPHLGLLFHSHHTPAYAYTPRQTSLRGTGSGERLLVSRESGSLGGFCVASKTTFLTLSYTQRSSALAGPCLSRLSPPAPSSRRSTPAARLPPLAPGWLLPLALGSRRRSL